MLYSFRVRAAYLRKEFNRETNTVLGFGNIPRVKEKNIYIYECFLKRLQVALAEDLKRN